MKKIRFFLALGLMIVALASCGENNQISVSELKTNELTQIDGDTLRVFSEVKKIAIDPNLWGGDSLQENLPLAYQNPGKKFTISQTKRQLYSAESFWTKFTTTTTSQLMHYSLVNEKVVSEIVVSSVEGVNVFPMLIFLILFILIVLNTLGLDDKSGYIIFCAFIGLNMALSIICDIDSGYPIFGIIVLSIMIAAINFALFMFIFILLDAMKVNKIPTLKRVRGNTAFIIALAIAISIRFTFFMELNPAYLYLVILLFLSPNIIAWTYMIIKSIIKKIKEKKQNKKEEEEKINTKEDWIEKGIE